MGIKGGAAYPKSLAFEKREKGGQAPYSTCETRLPLLPSGPGGIRPSVIA
ncbi:hypothetical protein VDG1235_2148 [Verrucomicrobiia bacterium DG1235]|nr:hypothetical protein VDG1235_2148 [Verrucomicrobiae bacterium DG1235]